MRRLIAPLLRLHSAAGSMDGKRRIKVVLFNVVARDENRGSGADAIAGVPVQHIAASVGAAAVADAVSRRAVHLLVDLSSHTAGGRLDALAHHPAPVSVSALGYAGTSGATFVHYLPVDRVAVPPPLSRHYVERNVHLPHSVHPAQHAAERATPLAHWRGAFGSRAVVGSWNSERKLGPNDWHLWGNVLRASPLTVLAGGGVARGGPRRLGDELLAGAPRAQAARAADPRVAVRASRARARHRPRPRRASVEWRIDVPRRAVGRLSVAGASARDDGVTAVGQHAGVDRAAAGDVAQPERVRANGAEPTPLAHTSTAR